MLQMADLIAHALLKQEEEPSPRVARLGIDRAFGTLDRPSTAGRQGGIHRGLSGAETDRVCLTLPTRSESVTESSLREYNIAHSQVPIGCSDCWGNLEMCAHRFPRQ